MERRFRYAAAATTVAGTALFGSLLYRTGIADVLAILERSTGAFLAALALAGARNVVRTIAWRVAIPARSRTVSLRRLFTLRVVGEALTALTFAGPVLGESAKAIAVAREMEPADAASSIFVENIAYTLVVATLILAGGATFLSISTLSAEARVGIAAAALALLVPAAALVAAARTRRRIVTGVLDRLARAGFRVGALERRRPKLERFESQVGAFFGGDARAITTIFALELAACATGIAEAYVLLEAVSGRGSLLAAFLVETVNRAVNTLFSFLPLRLGVDEGGAALVFVALGYTAAEGIALALVRKARTLVWIALGLVAAMRFSLARRDAAARQGK